jgi:hypothetical protein
MVVAFKCNQRLRRIFKGLREGGHFLIPGGMVELIYPD